MRSSQRPGVDPREYIIEKRLGEVRHIVPVVSYKGGVGKTVLSCMMTLALRDRGRSVGILDLDFTNPSVHIVLGIDPGRTRPIEERGLRPPEIRGVRVMTLSYYTRDLPAPMRGGELDNVFKEILSITVWDRLDYLVVDLPPGLSDIVLDTIKYLGTRSRPIVVSTPSRLSVTPTLNMVRLLREAGIRLLGVVINLYRGERLYIETLEKSLYREGVDILGRLGLDEGLEEALGDIDRLRETRLYREVGELVSRIEQILAREASEEKSL